MFGRATGEPQDLDARDTAAPARVAATAVVPRFARYRMASATLYAQSSGRHGKHHAVHRLPRHCGLAVGSVDKTDLTAFADAGDPSLLDCAQHSRAFTYVLA